MINKNITNSIELTTHYYHTDIDDEGEQAEKKLIWLLSERSRLRN